MFAEAELLRLREKWEGGREEIGGFITLGWKGKRGGEEEANQVSEQGGKLSLHPTSPQPPRPRPPGTTSAARAAGALGGVQDSPQPTAGS